MSWMFIYIKQHIMFFFFNMHQIWQQKIIEHLSVLDDVPHMFEYIPHIFPYFPMKNRSVLRGFPRVSKDGGEAPKRAVAYRKAQDPTVRSSRAPEIRKTAGGCHPWSIPLMDLYMDLYGFIWIYMDLYGFIWIYMDLYGFIWIYMDLYGFICIMVYSTA